MKLATLHNIQAALVDQEVCKRSTVFIGNNHSGWSEMTYYQRGWDEERGGLRPFGETYADNLQVLRLTAFHCTAMKTVPNHQNGKSYILSARVG